MSLIDIIGAAKADALAVLSAILKSAVFGHDTCKALWRKPTLLSESEAVDFLKTLCYNKQTNQYYSIDLKALRLFRGAAHRVCSLNTS